MSRYAVYVLALTVPPESCDPTLDPTKKALVLDDEQQAVDFVVRTVEAFLQQHQLWCGSSGVADEAEGATDAPASPVAVSAALSAAHSPLSRALATELERFARRPSPDVAPAASVTLPQTPTVAGHRSASSQLVRRHGSGAASASVTRVNGRDNLRRAVSTGGTPAGTTTTTRHAGTITNTHLSVARRLTQRVEALAGARQPWQRGWSSARDDGSIKEAGAVAASSAMPEAEESDVLANIKVGT